MEIDLEELRSLLTSEGAIEFRSPCCSNAVKQTPDGSTNSENPNTESGGLRTEDEFRIVTLYSEHGCTHEVVHRMGESPKPLAPISTPVHKYPFKLDPFQQQAILCIHNGRSVLVSAHTSAGKTAVAEYAVAQSLRENRRVIYTTPIKALSNQKYREFADEFKDVGLMTGDVAINTEASVLIMVTEVLRSMLYRGSVATRRVAWVVFDEVHYLRNKERGVVWEEAIILLPDDVGLVFLSATIPNAIQFAEWIVSLHHRPCHVVSTDIRPVPLEHYVFPCDGNNIHLVFNQKREFLEANFNAAFRALHLNFELCQFGVYFPLRRSGCRRMQPYCEKLVRLLMNQNLGPLIIFSFSRNECEHLFNSMDEINFNTVEENATVDSMFRKSISNLSDDDKKLPQFRRLLPSLRLGVGIHHSGLLPILRELVEVLFSRGLIKVLFATETFAMGMNVPARTVVFTNTRKHDGQVFREISSGEYVQMSGRAGRRGKDDRGAVIIMLDSTASSNATKELILSQPEPLDSSFYMRNNMVLIFSQMNNLSPEQLLEKSFYHFQNRWLERRIRMLEERLRTLQLLSDTDADQLNSYVELSKSLAELKREQWTLVMKTKSVLPFLQPGRVVRVCTRNNVDYGWGVVVNVNEAHTLVSDMFTDSPEESKIVVECLLQVHSMGVLCGNTGDESYKDDKAVPLSMVKPINSTFQLFDGDTVRPGKNAIRLISVPLSCLTKLSSMCLTLPRIVEGHPDEAAAQPLWEEIEKEEKEHDGSLRLLDPVNDMRIEDAQLCEYKEKIFNLALKLALHPLSTRSDIDYLVDTHTRRPAIQRDLDTYRKQLKNRDTLLHSNELRFQKHLLRRLGFCSEDGTMTRKGRIACKIFTGDEILLTELFQDGLFTSLTPVQIASVLSCFVAERSVIKQQITPMGSDLAQALKTVHAKARFLACAAAESRKSCPRPPAVESAGTMNLNAAQFGHMNSCTGMLADEQAYVGRFSGELMEVVRAWAEKSSFAKLCEITSAFEGGLIRCMRRLNELLREMSAAANVAGDIKLERKCLKASELINRDIVAASSLYWWRDHAF